MRRELGTYGSDCLERNEKNEVICEREDLACVTSHAVDIFRK